jgi:hypothetical protein
MPVARPDPAVGTNRSVRHEAQRAVTLLAAAWFFRFRLREALGTYRCAGT